ncbi:MAG: NPCBM/NEW2 domain-containing protein [Planctomycetia bacterium]|nr:NPCBM/NEW2 domain-containing protein [Planctomycetia bacterium]
MITRDFKVCDDFYGAAAPSRLKCPIPMGAKSFSAIGYNEGSRTAKYVVFIDGKQVYDSGVAGIAIVKVVIPAKASLLELVAEPSGEHCDHTYWCYPRFHSVASDKVTDKMLDGKLGTLKFSIASSSVGYGALTHNQPITGLRSVPVHFRDAQPCDEFLFAHAPSTVTYQVPEGMSRFTAIGYNVYGHHVNYEVWADAKRLYESPQAGIIPIDVKLPPGTKTIELKINDLGKDWGDHSMWCYPRLHRK